MVGLQYLSDDEPSVRRLIAALADKINQQPSVKGGAMIWQGATKQWSPVSGKGLSSEVVVKDPEERTKEAVESNSHTSEDTETDLAHFSAGNIALCVS